MNKWREGPSTPKTPVEENCTDPMCSHPECQEPPCTRS